MYIFIQAELVPALAEDIFIDPTPVLMVVLLLLVKEVKPVPPPVSAPERTSPNIDAGDNDKVSVPEILALLTKVRSPRVSVPAPAPEIAGLFVVFIMLVPIRTAADELITIGASISQRVISPVELFENVIELR